MESSSRSRSRSRSLRRLVSRAVNAPLHRLGLRLVRERSIDSWLAAIDRATAERDQLANEASRRGEQIVELEKSLECCRQELADFENRWSGVNGSGVPVFVTADGRPSL